MFPSFFGCFLTLFQYPCNSVSLTCKAERLMGMHFRNFFSDVQTLLDYCTLLLSEFVRINSVLWHQCTSISPSSCCLCLSNVVIYELWLLTLTHKVYLYANCCWEDLVQLMAKMASITAPFLGHSMVNFQEGKCSIWKCHMLLRVNCSSPSTL